MFCVVVATYLSVGITGYLISRGRAAGELVTLPGELFPVFVSTFAYTGGAFLGAFTVVGIIVFLVKKHRESISL